MPAKRFFALTMACGFFATAPVTFGQPVKLPMTGSTIIEWDSVPVTTNEHGFVRTFFSAPTAGLSNLECHVTTLNPGLASHPPHHHPQEEVIIVQQGNVAALINGEWKRVGPGSVIFNACNVTHDFRNVGDRPAVYHVFSWRSSLTPARADHTDTVEDSKVIPFKAGVMGPMAIEWNSVPVATNAAGSVREFFKSPTATAQLLELHATKLNPGASRHPPEPSPQEEVIVVEEGNVEALVNGGWKHVDVGSVIFNARNAVQGIRNVGSTPATYFVLEWRSHPA
jgi:quercetin dioxygenase-like cupin family protein